MARRFLAHFHANHCATAVHGHPSFVTDSDDTPRCTYCRGNATDAQCKLPFPSVVTHSEPTDATRAMDALSIFCNSPSLEALVSLKSIAATASAATHEYGAMWTSVYGQTDTKYDFHDYVEPLSRCLYKVVWEPVTTPQPTKVRPHYADVDSDGGSSHTDVLTPSPDPVDPLDGTLSALSVGGAPPATELKGVLDSRSMGDGSRANLSRPLSHGESKSETPTHLPSTTTTATPVLSPSTPALLQYSQALLFLSSINSPLPSAPPPIPPSLRPLLAPLLDASSNLRDPAHWQVLLMIAESWRCEHHPHSPGFPLAFPDAPPPATSDPIVSDPPATTSFPPNAQREAAELGRDLGLCESIQPPKRSRLAAVLMLPCGIPVGISEGQPVADSRLLAIQLMVAHPSLIRSNAVSAQCDQASANLSDFIGGSAAASSLLRHPRANPPPLLAALPSPNAHAIIDSLPFRSTPTPSSTWLKSPEFIGAVTHTDLRAAFDRYHQLYAFSFGSDSPFAEWARHFTAAFAAAFVSCQRSIPVPAICTAFDREWASQSSSLISYLDLVCAKLHNSTTSFALPSGHTGRLSRSTLWDLPPCAPTTTPIAVTQRANNAATLVIFDHRTRPPPPPPPTYRRTDPTPRTSSAARPDRDPAHARPTLADRIATRHGPTGSLHTLVDGRIMDEAIATLRLPHRQQPCLLHLLDGPSRCVSSACPRLHFDTPSLAKAYLTDKGARL